MSTITTTTTTCGEVLKIEAVAPGYSRIDAEGVRPEVVILKDGSGKWHAAFANTLRHRFLLTGWSESGGQDTREEAALWLLDGGC